MIGYIWLLLRIHPSNNLQNTANPITVPDRDIYNKGPSISGFFSNFWGRWCRDHIKQDLAKWLHVREESRIFVGFLP
jgi:hypothetical protein